ncbi:MAG TPA: cation transporter, partial [Pseudogracilibacillus sp.]|nr:cation transporter [Pseudogracilibacillus sp.]
MRMTKINLKVNGMSCAHCVSKVEKALQGLQGVEKAKVNLKKETAKVKYDDTVQTENNF